MLGGIRLLHVDIHSAGYTEQNEIIRNITFSIQAGEMVALIGANGAGKSTTIKALLGLLPHVEGTITFQGAGYAYVPEQPIYYDYLTLWEHIELLAATSSIDNGWQGRAEELLHIFRMEEKKHHYLTQFSKGMKQKAMLILAFLAKPGFYIVDEPFLGLDPTAIHDFLKLLKQEQERGAGILLCTHVLDTAERICERFLLVSEGNLLADGSLSDIQTMSGLSNGTLLECFGRIVRRDCYA